jgi:hypothetical protein
MRASVKIRCLKPRVANCCRRPRELGRMRKMVRQAGSITHTLIFKISANIAQVFEKSNVCFEKMSKKRRKKNVPKLR